MFAGLPEDELDVEIHRVFHSFDADGNSTLDKDEFAQAFNVMGLGLSREQCDAAFDQYDLGANGSIDAHEFCQMVSKRAKEDMCQHVVCWRSSSARAYTCMFCGSCTPSASAPRCTMRAAMCRVPSDDLRKARNRSGRNWASPTAS